MARRKVFSSESSPATSLTTFLRKIADIRKSWTHDQELTSRGDENGPWYRGQADATWGLVPSRWRIDHEDAIETEMRLEFESVGRQLVTMDQQRDKWGWYFLMAHYGAPTRLLDWTTNPLVALYFAVSNAKRGKDAAVWVVDPWKWNDVHVKGLHGPALPGWQETEPYLKDLEKAMETENGDVRRRWPVAIEPPHIDRRITVQEGRFFLFGTAKDMVSSPHVNRTARAGRRARLDKIVIPSAKTELISNELNGVSINEKTLFPDLGGLSRHIAWEWKKL